MNPKNPKSGASQLTALDYRNIRRLDRRTVMLPFHTPFSPLLQVLGDYYFFVVPVGYDPTNPVGTGPFAYKAFTPGQQSTFVRNENYWEHGLPYVDELIIADVADETSQVNSLLSGQSDAIDALSAASATSLQGQGVPVLLSATNSFTAITM